MQGRVNLNMGIHLIIETGKEETVWERGCSRCTCLVIKRAERKVVKAEIINILSRTSISKTKT